MPNPTIPSGRVYAQNTKVTVERTMIDIKKNLANYGATSFAHLESRAELIVMFVVNYGEPDQRQIKFTVDMPQRNEYEKTRGNKTRSETEIRLVMEREEKRIWRALSMIIKGRLIAVDEQVQTIEQAFFQETVNPETGLTVYEENRERISQSYARALPAANGAKALPARK